MVHTRQSGTEYGTYKIVTPPEYGTYKTVRAGGVPRTRGRVLERLARHLQRSRDPELVQVVTIESYWTWLQVQRF